MLLTRQRESAIAHERDGWHNLWSDAQTLQLGISNERFNSATQNNVNAGVMDNGVTTFTVPNNFTGNTNNNVNNNNIGVNNENSTRNGNLNDPTFWQLLQDRLPLIPEQMRIIQFGMQNNIAIAENNQNDFGDVQTGSNNGTQTEERSESPDDDIILHDAD